MKKKRSKAEHALARIAARRQRDEMLRQVIASRAAAGRL